MASSQVKLTGCVCKGVRTCLSCEQSGKTGKFQRTDGENSEVPTEENIYSYCKNCKKAWQVFHNSFMCQHSGNNFDFKGVEIFTDFVTEEEEQGLIDEIDSVEWIASQSGRRKQDYGPKVNFKKQKVNINCFTGLPVFSKQIAEKMKDIKVLENFIPIELCNLDYIPDRGSAIDPHFDDVWLWGERLVTLNLLSDTCYTMTHGDDTKKTQVSLPFPRRSLIVLYGPARHQWKHSIMRQDIHSRRVGITIRELSQEFLSGGTWETTGKQLIEKASTFNGLSVAEYERIK